METNIESTSLDFEAIRSSLKTYFEADEQFADYNFEGSALANLLDVLAWNTHFNALTANMAINESFLETSQLRSSIVGHAQSLGYFPTSKTAARATVQLSANLSSYVGTRPESITLPANTKFTTTVDGVSYTFQTLSAYTATDSGSGLYTFVDENGSSNLTVYEGTLITKTFYVPAKDAQPIYVIPDESMDTATAVVKVFSNRNTSAFSVYTDIKDAIRIDDTSRYYLMREAPNGYYELQFGSGNSIGLSPSAGNKVQVEYLRVGGSNANGAKTFTAQSSLSVDGQSFTLSASTQAIASNGDEKETLADIRYNAPLNYASQRRMVTKQDYESLISSTYSSVSSVSAWGGEEADPVDYGKIYLSLIFADENLDSDSKVVIKQDIQTNLIEPLATMSIDPVFVDPETLYLALTVRYDFNPNKTEKTAQTTSNNILSAIQTYFDTNLESFTGVFRKSDITSTIDNLSEAILSTRLDVKMVKRFTPTLDVNKAYRILFTEEIALPDRDEYTITSDTFVVGNRRVKIRNELGSTTLQLINETGTSVITPNIGSYDANSGVVTISSLKITSLLSGNTQIKIIATPANQGTIRPIRNYIIELDTALTSILPTIDYQGNRVSI